MRLVSFPSFSISEQWVVYVDSAVDNSHHNDIAVNLHGTVK